MVLGLRLAARAQYPSADASVVAGRLVRPAELCVDFDASRPVDPGAVLLRIPMEHGRWHYPTGLTITHYYQARGRY
jgi:hypothetical protein